ncbi:ATP-dependent DNA helicase RRM3 [Holothuria leucospilota]|uniref:ATP-dependent DNA helicase n=1 Tax=Holothuria leucospilota TaxID=206669 RepID=A0A9Q1BPI1_HOLLE|nr:ATP-dependent DNA helicase RRM3 [Holothuria leucospilota]
MKKIRGTPAYWECSMRDLFAMVRQLGIPTWFCSFSAADRRWTVIDEAILQQQGKAISKNIDWATHCEIIASNPVTATRMFEHRVQAFIKDVILSPAQPIGHVIDYFYRVEFQQRGWPHIHCLFWVKDAPLYGNSNTDEIVSFIDKYVSCKMPSAATEPKLHEKVLHVQMHSKNHSRSCRKGNRTCRFNFPRLPSKTTFISKPAVDADSVNNPTPGYSNAVKKLWDSFHHDTDHSLTIDEAFQRAGITQQQLQDCVTANTQKETIWLRREPSDIWVNNYNPILLMAWDANMDIQFVLDAYSCIMYIVSYISKAEREMGDLLKTAQQEAREGNLNAMDELRKLGSLYLHHREVSVIESVYRVTGMHMKQCSRQAIFIPTDPDSQRLSLPLQQLQNKQEDTDEIWMPNMIDKYLGRPKELANICLATFASEYRYIGQQNNATDSISIPTGLGTIKKRLNKPAIIRYPKVKIQKDREKYYSTILRLYLPFTVEEFKPSTYDTFQSYFLQGSYTGKFVREIVAASMQKYEPLAKELDNLWENLQGNPYQENSWANLAPQTEMERIQHTQEMSTEEYIPPECSEIISELQQPTFSSNGMVGEFALERMDSSVLQSEITSMLRTLNNEQRQLFNHMQQWSKHKVNDNDTKPPYIFLTGGAGTGKSQLIKCITHELRKCFSKIAESPDDITVLLVAYTGTAAFNIHGQTIHSAFNIFNPTKHYKPLREEHLNTLCAKYRSLQLVIIDEISMVDHNMLLYIHGRLQQIKRSDTMHIFGNVGILAVGDFYQIQPVFGKPLYRKDHGAFVDLWIVDAHNIKMLHSLQSRVEFIEAVDIIGTANATLKKLLKPTPNAKSTLPAELNIAIGACVMLTTNLDVADGLVNGVTGKVTGIFQAGMAYVALSRVVTLGGLYLTDFDSSLIYCNAEMQKISGIINNSDPKKPYHPPLKVVLATRSDRIFYKKGTTDKEMMYVALCDTTGHLKATLYEPSKLDNITNGSTIIIRNYMVRDDKTIAITSQSQIFKSSQLQVPENLLSQAISVRPPTPPPIPIKEVHTSPVKTLTSVSGVIAQKTERPAEDISEEIIAYIEDENDMIHLLLASNEMLSTNIELLKTTFNIEDDNWQPVLEAFIPFKANMTVKEGEITRINIQSVANMDNP